MNAFLNIFDNSLKKVTIIFSWLASIAIVFATLLICADVGMRNFFNMPINGVSEIVAYGIVSVVFLQLANTIRAKRLITVDFLSNYLKVHYPQFISIMNVAFFFGAAFIFYKITEYFGLGFLKSYSEGEFTGAIGAYTIPTWPFKLVNTIASAFALIELIRILIISLSKLILSQTSRNRLFIPELIILGLVFLSIYFLIVIPLAGIQIGALVFLIFLFLICLGIPISLSLILLSFIGIWAVRDKVIIAYNSLGMSAGSAIQSFEFGVVPLFVFMGMLLEKSDVGKDSFQIAVRALRKIKGGLGIATVFANAIFASITGSSIASASVFSRISVPPMVEHKFTKRFAVGVVAGSSVLGMLIPPSVLLIIYGVIAEVSIGKLFIGAILPGIILAFAFSLMILLLAKFLPNFVGTPSDDLNESLVSSDNTFLKILPILGLIFLVMGGIYGGIFSPTEAGAIGACGAFLIGLIRKKFTFNSFGDVVFQTGFITSGILFLIISSSIYTRMLALTGVPMWFSNLLQSYELSIIGFMLIFLVLIIIMGMILDSISALLIILPIALPTAVMLNVDPIWFGIITVITIELGLLTPPFGLSVFVVKSSLPDNFASLSDIFIGAFPFVLMMILVIILLLFFPSICTVFL